MIVQTDSKHIAARPAVDRLSVPGGLHAVYKDGFGPTGDGHPLVGGVVHVVVLVGRRNGPDGLGVPDGHIGVGAHGQNALPGKHPILPGGVFGQQGAHPLRRQQSGGHKLGEKQDGPKFPRASSCRWRKLTTSPFSQ